METKVGIIGLGLIGGSIARAVKAFLPQTGVIAYNRSRQALDEALRDGSIDWGTQEVDDAFTACTLILVCLPAEHTLEVLKRLRTLTTPDTLIVDAASTKVNMMQMALDAGIEDRFIGGHPMAGSEQTGYAASKANLYENAWFVMTPFPHTAPDHIARIHQFVSSIGALPLVMDAAEHDRVTAMISHLPHVVASLLVNLVRETDSQEGFMHLLAAGGFRDITRIASSSASLWNGICMNNKERMLEALDKAIFSLNRFRALLEAGDEDSVTAFFREAQQYRDSFSAKKPGSFLKLHEITVDVDDRPGIIARVATVLAEHGLNIKNMGINNSREGDEGALVIRFDNEQDRAAGMKALQENAYRVTYRI